MELVEVILPISYESKYGFRKGKVSLLVMDKVRFLRIATKVDSGNLIEIRFQRIISTLKGKYQPVMNDVYRHLVIGNYTSIKDHQGYDAIPILDEEYPDNETLPDFELKTIAFNTSGMILYNLLRHPEPDQESYRILSAILVAMVENKALETPKMDLRQEQTKDLISLIK